MKVTLIPVTPFQQNCSLLVCEATRRAAVVDPGGDLELIQGEVARQNVTVEKVFLTHGHIDHCAGAKSLADALRRADRRPASRRTFLDRQAAGSKHALWFSGRAGIRAGPLAARRRHGPVRRRDARGLSLPRAHARSRDLLQPRAPARTGGRRAVRRLDRPHGFSARQPRRPDSLDPRKALAARRRRHLRAGPRPHLDVRRRAPHESATSPTESAHEQPKSM